MKYALPQGDLQSATRAAAESWELARGKTIFLTGGTGFFGSWLLESFHNANVSLGLGAKLFVLSRSPENYLVSAPHARSFGDIHWVKGDVRTFDFISDEVDLIVHAATDASAVMNLTEPITMFDTIVTGTRHVLDFAGHCGAKRLLFVSSGAVYGQVPGDIGLITEDYSGAPDPSARNAAYGEAKRVAEMLCHIASRTSNLSVSIARCFAFVGPGLPLNGAFALGNFIQDALEGGKITVHGDGTPLRSYLYASDLAVWLWNILFRSQNHSVYNVGSDQSVSISELAQVVRSMVDPRCEIDIKQAPDANVGYNCYVPSVDRARSHLGLQIEVSLEQGITKMVDWIKSNMGESID